MDQEWLIRFVEHRVGDRRIVRLIRKWLKAGVLEDGIVTISEKGTGQGAVISPLLANVYLHYGLDQWAEGWQRHDATGDMIIVRYADDFIVGLEYESDARCFLDAMRERLGKFALSIHSCCPEPDSRSLVRALALRAPLDQVRKSEIRSGNSRRLPVVLHCVFR
jgi:retron-type reverse transcriptase